MTTEVAPLDKTTGVTSKGNEDVAIWLDPPRFWSATRNMSKDEVGGLLDEVMSLAERRDLIALRRYDFISLYRRSSRAED
ncbi:MAG: hypothetical protein ABSD20_07600 [Terriglobales bacterium]|jgi:hypothetical protein